MIANADKDGTGTLDLIEFLQMMKEKISEQNKEEEIGEAFRVFDIVSVPRDTLRVVTFISSGSERIHRQEGTRPDDEVHGGACHPGGD